MKMSYDIWSILMNQDTFFPTWVNTCAYFLNQWILMDMTTLMQSGDNYYEIVSYSTNVIFNENLTRILCKKHHVRRSRVISEVIRQSTV